MILKNIFSVKEVSFEISNRIKNYFDYILYEITSRLDSILFSCVTMYEVIFFESVVSIKSMLFIKKNIISLYALRTFKSNFLTFSITKSLNVIIIKRFLYR